MSTDLIPYSDDITLQRVSDQTAEAVAVICGVAARLEALNRANVYYRFVLGKQLAVIRDRQLWRDIYAYSPSQTWDEWLQTEFPVLTGIGDGTAHGALKLAASPALNELDDAGLKGFQNLYNPIQLARAEANGRHITPLLIEQAQQLPVKQFRRVLGVPENQGRVEHVVDDPRTASDLQIILALLKQCDHALVREFRVWLDKLFQAAGGSPDDTLMAVNAAIEHEILSQVEPEPEVYGDLGVEEVKHFHTNQGD